MRLFYLIAPLFLALQVQAGKPCVETAATKLDMNQCMNKRYKNRNNMLKVSYKAALARIDNSVPDQEQRQDTKKNLAQAQKIWIQFRDKDCDAVFQFWRGGTIRVAKELDCMIKHTNHRIKYLDSFKYEN